MTVAGHERARPQTPESRPQSPRSIGHTLSPSRVPLTQLTGIPL